jgi:hypothetical protein
MSSTVRAVSSFFSCRDSRAAWCGWIPAFDPVLKKSPYPGVTKALDHGLSVSPLDTDRKPQSTRPPGEERMVCLQKWGE